MKLFFPGQKVPGWIQKVEIKGYHKGDPHLRFSSPSLVWVEGKQIMVRPIVMMDSVMKLTATCDHVSVTGNPYTEGGSVTINCKAIINNWVIITLLALILLTFILKGVL